MFPHLYGSQTIPAWQAPYPSGTLQSRSHVSLGKISCRVPMDDDQQCLGHGHSRRSIRTSSIVPWHPYLETVSAYQVSVRSTMVDELILGFQVLNGAWKFSGMATSSKIIANDSCLVGSTTHGLRAALSATGLSLIVGVQDLVHVVSLPRLGLWVTPLIVISTIRAKTVARCVCAGPFIALHFSVLLDISTYGAPNGCRFSFHAHLWSLPRDVAENCIQFIPSLRKNCPLRRGRLGPYGSHVRSPIRDRSKDEGKDLTKNQKRQRGRAPKLMDRSPRNLFFVGGFTSIEDCGRPERSLFRGRRPS